MKAFFVLLATGIVMLAQTPPPAKPAAPATKSAAPAAKAPAVNPLLHPETLKARAPEEFTVKFTTTAGDFVVTVHRAWAPLGADRFYNLVRSRFFTNAAFFRVLPGFIVQFGLNPDPKVNSAFDNAYIKDDPMKPGISNKLGTLVYAQGGPNTRSTQLFINLANNGPALDNQPGGFPPFGEVTEGMDVVKNIYSGYGGDPSIPDPGGRGPRQNLVGSQGKPYLDKNFPLLTVIKSATVVPAAGAAIPATKSTSSATKSTLPATKSTSAPPKK
jgi:peptidyl-prolyl cis-trans isomerase A (cyclophilin A)